MLASLYCTYIQRTLHFSTGLSAANGGRKTVSSNRRRPLCNRRERRLWSRHEKCGPAFTAHAGHIALLYCSDPPSQRGGTKNVENIGVSLLSWYASIAETGLSSKTTPVGCSQDICLYSLTFFSSYVRPEYGCIMFPRSLGIRLSVCTLSQHGRL